jgi:predicted RNA binding protein YcfA (HicA-like mRNA interferase family)
MKAYTSHDLLRILKRDGWEIKHIVGSHYQLVHPTKKGKVTLPHPKRNLAIGTVRSVLRQAGIDEGALP